MFCRLTLVALLCAVVSYTEAQSSRVFLQGLKSAPAKVVLSDGSLADPSEVRVVRSWKGDRCALSVSNISKRPMEVREVIIFDWQHHLPGSTPIYGEGFQKLSQTGGTIAHPLDIGSYTDRGHYKIPEPENLRTVYGMLALDLGENDRVLLAASSCNRFISRFSFDDRRMRISLDCENLTLAPGQSWRLEEFMAIAGGDRDALYDRLVQAIQIHHPSLTHGPVPMGWCSWSCFGPEVTAKNVLDNANWIVRNIPQLKYIQIDDGYQPWMGDWLDTGAAFGGNAGSVLSDIRSKGLIPAIWVAPFIASPQSRLFKEHPDWMVKDSAGLPLRSDRVTFGGWREGPWYVLDGTNPAVQDFLTHVFKTMREKWGCLYFKLDANCWGAMQGGVHYDKHATRIEAYRRGMAAIRKGAGDDAFLLGCNHPIWPSLGLINGSRSSNDIQRSWESFTHVGRENLSRGWQNGRLWWNDPDCILLADKNPENEILFHAAVIYATGGLLLSGDDLPNLAPDRVALLRSLIPPSGKAASFANNNFDVGLMPYGSGRIYVVFNWGDSAVDRTLRLPNGKYMLSDKWTGRQIGSYRHAYTIRSLPPHSAMLIKALPVN